MVHVVLNGDHGEVGHFRLSGQVLPIGVQAGFGDVVTGLGCGTANGIEIRNGYDFQLLGMVNGVLAIGVAAVAIADNNSGEFFHK